MEQATQPTTTTPAETTDPDPGRATYARARALADALVGQARILPTSVDIHRYLTSDLFELRLHFGTGLEPARGVLALAAVVGADIIREDERADARSGAVVWIEADTTVDGVRLLARALTNTEDADRLLPPDGIAPAEQAGTVGQTTQPIPTVSTNPAAVVAPAITPVPLSARNTAVEDEVARCVRCGCTDDAACDGGCYWVPNEQMVDLCSACATPQQRAAMVLTPVSGSPAGGE
ncbi:hypothetical protein [Streptomyces sp. STCH 565 A]|uniref:hypothetical protein n=1 Tax=Streptomyces sp. STCH 565 A TaxID=2950532 RepID=UPI002074BC36|nr:hypothetical protein [Streptomyces sp. STCH 565 A]MCM8548958.1 hypothetical protein [Streptomyces sp. STCH 565 A]